MSNAPNCPAPPLRSHCSDPQRGYGAGARFGVGIARGWVAGGVGVAGGRRASRVGAGVPLSGGARNFPAPPPPSHCFSAGEGGTGGGRGGADPGLSLWGRAGGGLWGLYGSASIGMSAWVRPPGFPNPHPPRPPAPLYAPHPPPTPHRPPPLKTRRAPRWGQWGRRLPNPPGTATERGRKIPFVSGAAWKGGGVVGAPDRGSDPREWNSALRSAWVPIPAWVPVPRG